MLTWPEDLEIIDARETWLSLVTQYCKSQLTHQDCKLATMSGLA
jgi:hypothetical protein